MAFAQPPLYWVLRSPLVLLGVALAACASGAGDDSDGAGIGPDVTSVRIDAAPPAPDAPTLSEVCDGQDNDGDQFVDEGTAEALCSVVANAAPVCNGLGGCAVATCSAGFVDLDLRFDTGCECANEPGESEVDECATAFDLGELPDTNTLLLVEGTLAPENDVDHYRFRAVDVADDACDAFHVRITLAAEHQAEFAIDVRRGGCEGTLECEATPDYAWFTNFTAGPPPAAGECPCYVPGGPDQALNHCTDDSADYIVRVYRVPGAVPTCTSYQIELSNGHYPAP
ncbi:MAG: hypothetical protein EXR73_13965 [Myxococcales bacterium]|nr:hypothetical protein [Myxococcales bacterium]